MLDDANGWSWSRPLITPKLAMVLLATVAIGAMFYTGGTASASLPDGRAWEMVSPLAKNGGDVRGIDGDSGGGVVQASSNGDRITYVSLASFGEARGAAIGSQYVSDRDAGAGWLAQNISTPMSNQTYYLAGLGTPYRAFASDLSSGLVFGGARSGGGAQPVENPPLAGALAGYEDYYLNAYPSGALQPLLSHAPGVPPEAFGLEFIGATPDLKHVVVQSSAALGANPEEEPGTSNLYEWESASGRFQLVNVLPNGTIETAHSVSLGGSGGAQGQAISEDGSRVIWTAESNPSAVYMRESRDPGQPQTVQVDAPTGEGRYLTASSDGAKVFFADHNRLTGGSTAGADGLGDLYKFSVEKSGSERLEDLTIDHTDAQGAGVLGVLGASADGSYLYFVANGVLAAGASHGTCSTGTSSPGATCNLYLWHEGEGTRFIGTLSGNDESGSAFNILGVAFDWDPSISVRTARVSQDGTRVVFMSENGSGLTGYDSTVRTGSSCGKNFNEVPLPAQCEEVFLYEANTHRLTCVSCNPTGARPTGPSGIPGGTQFRNLTALYQSRALSEDGSSSRLFFESMDGLTPQDTNGADDVYEYENGRVYLLSDGSSPGGTAFVDASVNGDDVFVITRSQLVGQDTDRLVDIYDARAPHAPGERVGFPVTPSESCEGESCRPPSPPAPVFSVPTSVAFAGLGNVSSADSTHSAKAQPKKSARPKKRAKKHKRKAGRRRKARAGTAFRGAIERRRR